MASLERRGNRALIKHRNHVQALVKECLSKMDGVSTRKDVKVYNTFKHKWAAHCKMVNSDTHELVSLQESAFETYMDQIAKQMKMKKKASQHAEMGRPGLFNVLFAAMINLFRRTHPPK